MARIWRSEGHRHRAPQSQHWHLIQRRHVQKRISAHLDFSFSIGASANTGGGYPEGFRSVAAWSCECESFFFLTIGDPVWWREGLCSQRPGLKP